jgi:hypothetical protein
MATNNGPLVVKSGLSLCLDAADIKSYPRSGTSWNDISGNRRTATLNNFGAQTIFSSVKGGSIIFDGSDDYATCTVSGGLGSGAFTLEFWYYKSTDSGFIFNSRSGGTGGDGIDISHSLSITTAGHVLFNALSAGIINTNTWAHVLIGRSSDNSMYRYVNSNLIDTRSGLSGGSGNDFSGGTVFSIGGNTAGNVGYLNGYMSILRVYNKFLSDNERLQNFNSQRGRFGI